MPSDSSGTCDEKGVRPRIVAVEVISDDLVSRGVDVAAHTCADAAREVLRVAGQP